MNNPEGPSQVEAKQMPSGGDKLDARTTLFRERIEPAIRKLRPKFQALERQLRGSGVFDKTWEDLQQITASRIWQGLNSTRSVQDPEAYVRTVAESVALECRRGPGLRRAKYRILAVFAATPDQLATWRNGKSIVGGRILWKNRREIGLFEFEEAIRERFRQLAFWQGDKIVGEAIKQAVFQIFDCTGGPVRISQMVMVIASYLEILDPAWVPAAETPDSEARIVQFPASIFDGESESPDTKDRIRLLLRQVRTEPIEKRMALLKELDLVEIAGRGFVTEIELAEMLCIRVEELQSWLYVWLRTPEPGRKNLFDAGSKPEKKLWSLREKLKKLLSIKTLPGIIALFCHLIRN